MSRLPRGYLQLEYIQSTGTQYVDTRFKHNQNTRVVMDVQLTSTPTENTWLFEGRNGTGSNTGSHGVFFYDSLDDKWTSDYSGGNSRLNFSGIAATDRLLIDYDKNVCTINGQTVTHAELTFQSNYNLYLLADNRAGGLGATPAAAKLWMCQIYDNGVLVRDYVPCVSPSGAVGLFDLVGREFYGNAGTGTFTAGPVVLPALPRGYKRLQYIQSSGAEYIDTRFKPKSTTRVVADIEVTAGASSALFGARANSSANATSYSFSMFQIGGTSLRSDFGSVESTVSLAPLQRLRIDKDGNKTTVNGTTVTATAQTFASGYDLTLFTVNTAGAINATKTAARLYSCQIYDNGVPVRCFVPCINPSGEVGLYDAIFHKFYGNAGAGSFTGEEFPEAALPDGYQRVEYIQSTGTQCADTGVVGNQSVEFAVEFEISNSVSSSDQGSVLGCLSSTSARYEITTWTNNDYGGQFCFGTNFYDAGITQNARMTMTLRNGTLTTPRGTVSVNASAFDSGISIALFGRHRQNVCFDEFAKMKLYSCRIYDNGTLIRNYIPCVELATGKAGLYDLVNGTFSASAGSGAFISGPVVNTGIYEEPEITFLEYIEGTGTQYIDTRFAPNQDTKVVCRAVYTQGSSATYLFGSDAGSGSSYFAFGSANGNLRYAYNTSSYYFESGLSFTDVITIEADKNVATINGSYTVAAGEAAFSSGFALYLFGDNRAGTLYGVTPAKVYSCQIYDDGAFVRDYLPARTSDGDVGLWDNVDCLFYPNAGTGVFLAGPEVEQTPSAPTGFAASVEGDKVTLRWDAKDEVLGYRVYRDGLLLADTTATEIEDTVTPFVRTTYAVSAYNDLGEGKAAELTVYFVPENPVLYLVTDRTAADVAAGNAKGSYTATDLNRVGYAMLYIADIVTKQGIDAPVTPKTDWTDGDWVDTGDADAYLKDLATLRNAVAVMSTTPNPPADLEQFGFQQANDIEQILVDIHVMLSLVLNNLLYAGEIFAGEA